MPQDERPPAPEGGTEKELALAQTPGCLPGPAVRGLHGSAGFLLSPGEKALSTLIERHGKAIAGLVPLSGDSVGSPGKGRETE